MLESIYCSIERTFTMGIVNEPYEYNLHVFFVVKIINISFPLFLYICPQQRPMDQLYVGELYVDRDFEDGKLKGSSCKFSLGTKTAVEKYIQVKIYRDNECQKWHILLEFRKCPATFITESLDRANYWAEFDQALHAVLSYDSILDYRTVLDIRSGSLDMGQK